MSASDTPLDQRLGFIKHKGKAVYAVDFTNCTGKEMLLLLDQIRADVGHHAPNSVLILADFKGAKIDKNVATRMKEVLVLDRPFVKRSAWMGTESMPEVFYEHFKNFSQRDFPTFKTREEALDWLVSDS
ncbi:MAG: hypothetical protein WA252_01245 [Candidatus Sulfotelmatobacter sp.]|jgi:hypothetical protein